MTAQTRTTPNPTTEAEGTPELVPTAMVGRALFEGDWIGQLSETDKALLEKHGPRDILASGDLMEIIDRCPTADIANRVDRALGRHHRMLAQWNTARRWLIENGPPANFGTYDVGALKLALRRLEKIEPADLKRPGRGRRPDVLPRVVKEMLATLKAEEYTAEQLFSLPSKQLGHRFNCGKTTASAALDQVRELISRTKAENDK
jgi:hypothetical protein